MSEPEKTVTSPNLPTSEGIIHTPKDFSGSLTLELSDEDIKRGFELVMKIKSKWESRFRSKFNDPSTFELDDVLKELSEFEDEVRTRLAEELNVLATVDTVPILDGQPPIVDWVGKLPGDALYSYGFDHERKEWEVKRATVRGEDYLGQKD